MSRSVLKDIIYEAKVKQSVCANCDEKNLNLLDFAHWSRFEKNANLSDIRSIEGLKQELQFGRFLCMFCHKIETDEENVQIQKKKEIDVIEKARGNANHTCLNCHENVNSQSLRKGRCVICEYKRQNFYYVNAKRARDFLKKQRGKCCHCSMVVSKNNINLFEFDHIREGKTGNIGDMKNVEDIKNEAQKCQLLCSKCHRLKTLRQISFRKNN